MVYLQFQSKYKDCLKVKFQVHLSQEVSCVLHQELSHYKLICSKGLLLELKTDKSCQKEKNPTTVNRQTTVKKLQILRFGRRILKVV